MRCSICNSEAPGAFCPGCGAPKDGARCRACESPLVAGARYCTQCGQAVRAAASSLPWYVAGASLAALIIVLLLPTFRAAEDAAAVPSGVARPDAAASGPIGGAPGGPGPLTGTPREQADRLFNRVMQAQAQGDSAQASFFLPMAVAAYRQAGDLDADGLYHLSVLEVAAGDPGSGRSTAERILAASPGHILALGAAAHAAVALGDQAAARAYYERLLAAFAAEQARPLPEYRDHGPILPDYRNEAEAYLGR